MNDQKPDGLDEFEDENGTPLESEDELQAKREDERLLEAKAADLRADLLDELKEEREAAEDEQELKRMAAAAAPLIAERLIPSPAPTREMRRLAGRPTMVPRDTMVPPSMYPAAAEVLAAEPPGRGLKVVAAIRADERFEDSDPRMEVIDLRVRSERAIRRSGKGTPPQQAADRTKYHELRALMDTFDPPISGAEKYGAQLILDGKL